MDISVISTLLSSRSDPIPLLACWQGACSFLLIITILWFLLIFYLFIFSIPLLVLFQPRGALPPWPHRQSSEAQPRLRIPHLYPTPGLSLRPRRASEAEYSPGRRGGVHLSIPLSLFSPPPLHPFLLSCPSRDFFFYPPFPTIFCVCILFLLIIKLFYEFAFVLSACPQKLLYCRGFFKIYF